MLEHLNIRGLGPSPQMDLHFGERVNLVTGDNGLGKTFLLDLAWFALTRTWADGRMIRPAQETAENAELTFTVQGKGGTTSDAHLAYKVETAEWSQFQAGPPPAPGLASMETHWDYQRDKLFNLELSEDGRQVQADEVRYALFGDASGWLTSAAFDLESGYGREAERAMQAADAFMSGLLSELPEDLSNRVSIHQALERTLDGGDPFWAFWLPFCRESEESK